MHVDVLKENVLALNVEQPRAVLLALEVAKPGLTQQQQQQQKQPAKCIL